MKSENYFSESWIEAFRTGIIPDFPERGLYRIWDHHWNPSGYADVAQYPGQMPECYPLDWSPIMCFLVSKNST
ncbi:MAG: hypothetical protein EP345_17625 [Sphingomonadales bacterium]|nr:MAG: hypothetical protein EP345_17625 [Sphingomonadales bacterium]